MDYADIHQAIQLQTATDAVPRWTLTLLRDIASGRSELTELTAVRHPLGFLCFPVQRLPEHGVCVHLWTPAVRPALTTSRMHSHSWDLISYVLYGTLRNERIRVTEAPAEARASATHRVFEVRSHDDVDELRPTSRLVRYQLETVGEHGAGCVYDLPAGEFHATVPAGDQNVATVVLGRMRSQATDLSLCALDTRSHRVTRSHCDPAETARAARLIAGRLEIAGLG